MAKPQFDFKGDFRIASIEIVARDKYTRRPYYNSRLAKDHKNKKSLNWRASKVTVKQEVRKRTFYSWQMPLDEFVTWVNLVHEKETKEIARILKKRMRCRDKTRYSIKPEAVALYIRRTLRERSGSSKIAIKKAREDYLKNGKVRMVPAL